MKQTNLKKMYKIKKKLVLILAVLTLFSYIYYGFLADPNNINQSLFTSKFGSNEQVMTGLGDINNMFQDIIRMISWWLIMLLASLVDGISYAIDQILSINIFHFAFLNQSVKNAKVVGLAITGITVAIAGIQILYKGSEVLKDLMTKIVLIVATIVFLLPATSWFYSSIFIPGVDFVNNGDLTNLGTQTVVENTYDLEATLQNGEPTKILNGKLATNEEVKKQNINFLKYGSIPVYTINQDNIPKEYKGYKSVNTPTGYAVEELNKGGWWGIGSEDIYRYSYSFLNIFIPLIIIGISLLLMGFRIAKVSIFEILFAIITSIAFFVPRSKTTGEVLKIIDEILKLFIGLIFTLLALQFYLKLIATPEITNLQFIPQMIVLAGISFSLISGSDFVNKIFNFDTGVKDGAQALMGANQGLALAGKFGSGIQGMRTTAGKIDQGIEEGIKSEVGQMTPLEDVLKDNQAKENGGEDIDQADNLANELDTEEIGASDDLINGALEEDSNIDFGSEDLASDIDAESNLESEDLASDIDAESNLESEDLASDIDAESNLESEDLASDVDAESNLESEDLASDIDAESNLGASDDLINGTLEEDSNKNLIENNSAELESSIKDNASENIEKSSNSSEDNNGLNISEASNYKVENNSAELESSIKEDLASENNKE